MTDEASVPARPDEPTALSARTQRPLWRQALPWLLGVLLAVNVATILATLSFANATQEAAAQRSLRQAIAILSEVDAYLDTHHRPLREEASSSSGQAITTSDFLVEVSFTPDEVLSTDREEFRALLLTRAAGRVYNEGTAAIRGDRSTEEGEISGEDALRTGMDFFRPRPHRIMTGLTVALACLAAGLSVALVLASRGPRGLVGLGAAVLLASGALLIAAIAVRFAFRLAADGTDDLFVREFLELGQELTWAPIRNGIIFVAGGAILCLLAVSLLVWEARQARTA